MFELSLDIRVFLIRSKSFQDFLPSGYRLLHILLRCLPRLLDETMQEVHAVLFHAKKNMRNSVAGKVGADLEDSAPHGFTGGHSNRPPGFHGENVVADQPPILSVQTLEPIPNRLVSGWGFEESCLDALHERNVLFLVRLSRPGFGTAVSGGERRNGNARIALNRMSGDPSDR